MSLGQWFGIGLGAVLVAAIVAIKLWSDRQPHEADQEEREPGPW